MGVVTGRLPGRVSVGAGHAVALKANGVLSGWGLNTSGQLGTGTEVIRKVPYAF